jgi:heat shock protein HslJ
MKYLLFQLVLIAALFGFVSCKSSKTITTENTKTKQTELTEKHWKLVELSGIMVSETSREPFIVFEKDEDRFHGNTSCNNFFGTFELNKKNKIKFSQGGMTKMACIGNKVETPFLEALENAVSYKYSDRQLTLSDDKKIVIAKFIYD